MTHHYNLRKLKGLPLRTSGTSAPKREQNFLIAAAAVAAAAVVAGCPYFILAQTP